jgi:hypothetical protein
LFDEYRARLKQVLRPDGTVVKPKKPGGREDKVKRADQQAARSEMSPQHRNYFRPRTVTAKL